MSLTVTKGKPTSAEVFHQATDKEITLVIGEYRLISNASDVYDLADTAALLDKLLAVASAARRDTEQAIVRHQQAEHERIRAAANATAAPSCSCGQPGSPDVVHRTGLPCHAASITPCFTCQGRGCKDCARSGIEDVAARPGTPLEVVRETTHVVRPYVPAAIPISTPTRAAGRPAVQQPACGCSEHGPCPLHGGPVPGEETRDLTAVTHRPLQVAPSQETQR
jgi:hypothetical protein